MNEKEKFTESHIIYSRILWDNALDKQHFWIGFTDRMSASGIREKYLLDWNPEGDIPWHRVVYIRCKDIKVWDRKQKVDLFKEHKLPDFVWKQPDNPFATQIISNGELQMQFDHHPCYGFVGNEWQPSSISSPLSFGEGQGVRFLTWNVLKNTHNPELTYSDLRLPAILQKIKEAHADVIALQEVTKDVYQKLLAQDWTKQYFVSDLPTSEVFEQDTIVILSKFPFVVTEHVYSKHKRLLIARFSGDESPVYVATVHLTSDMSHNSSQKRAQQMQVFFDWLNTIQGEVLVLGDFNADTDEQTQLFAGKGFTDAWRGAEVEGFTYNPKKNLLAQMLSPTQRVRRLDALHIKSSHWQARQASLYATESFAEVAGKPLFCSDHFGVLATLERVASKDLPTPFANAKPTYQSVLAWVPPQNAWRNIQEIRALHDSKYNRWMPHITLIYGFIAEELFAEAVPLIAEAVADIQPFEITLESVQFFEHRQSFTAWLQPDANATRQLQILQARLQKIFPTCDEQSNRKPPSQMERGGDIGYSFTPHLSIGQFDSLEELQKIVPLWKPVKTQVSEIVLKSREKDTPFVVRYQIPLGKQGFTKLVPAWQLPIDTLMPVLTSKDKENRATVLGIISQACAEAIPQTVQVEQMGSAYLGIHTPQSDIDVVCIIPKEVERTFFLNKLQDVLSLFATSMRLAEDAQVPVLKLVINEVAVDILVAQSPIFPVVFALPALLRQQQHFDTLSWQIISGILEAETLLKTAQEVVNLDNFRQYVRAVRAWAKARGLVGNGWGYLGSYSWTVLTVNALLAYPKQEQTPSLEAFLAFFFKWYALYDWKEVVALTRVGKAYKAHKRDKMPIITSIEPCFNSAKNVTRSTSKRIKAELNRAHNLTKKTPTESNWDTLFDKADWVGKPQSIPLAIKVKAIDSPTLLQAVGWLEGNIIGFWTALEQDENLTIEFLPALQYQVQEATLHIWVNTEKLDKVFLEAVWQDFASKFGVRNSSIFLEF